ncbi:MAG: PEP-CTERM sorting domain-containing protein [Verrucomicrobia bacterium]|nr:PEP-CTERM sorting domain-containing protein [Verrucomicrobiota bacterium]
MKKHWPVLHASRVRRLGWIQDGSALSGSWPASLSRLMRRRTPIVLAAFVLLLAGNVGAQYNILHNFTGGANDSASPYGSPTVSGSTLYGMTYNGGTSDRGTVFSMNVNGTGFGVLHSFTGGSSDGAYTKGGVTVSGSTLYGMTRSGGIANQGTVFSMNVNGSGFGLLHSFTNGPAYNSFYDGSDPLGSLTLAGSALYGMTWMGGANDYGVTFSLTTDGAVYDILHTFTGSQGSGFGTPTISGSTLYVMTYSSIFSMNTDGTGLNPLHQFTWGAGDGGAPHGDLTLVGSTLYGMTTYGGSSNSGVVFSINTDGTGYGILHSFTGTGSEGGLPYGSLTFAGSKLYGMTSRAGNYLTGSIFSINTNGTDFNIEHTFGSVPNDGGNPYGSLVFDGSTLYGMGSSGGSGGLGTIFSLQLAPEPSAALLVVLGGAGLMAKRRRWARSAGIVLVVSLLLLSGSARAQYNILHNFTGGANDGAGPMGTPTVSGSTVYGMTYYGGTSGQGAVFSMNINGSGFGVLHSFTGGSSDGAYTKGSLTISGSTLYGMTIEGSGVAPSGGPTINLGTVFSLNDNGTGFTLLHSFMDALQPPPTDGAYPYGSLTLSGSTLYGMTSMGGSSDYGIVFSMNPDGSGYNILHNFSGWGNGSSPGGSLLISGSTLYGMAGSTIFSMNTSGTGFTALHTFWGDATGGAGSLGDLTLVGSTLYGMTKDGGSSDGGVIFSIQTDGTGFTLLHTFTGDSHAGVGSGGITPFGSLTYAGSKLFGMTAYGGSSNKGVLFSINTNGTGFTVEHSFGSVANDGVNPYGSLAFDGSTLYGMTEGGGTSSGGTIFSLQGIPEPSSAVLLALGGAGLLARWGRRGWREGRSPSADARRSPANARKDEDGKK